MTCLLPLAAALALGAEPERSAELEPLLDTLGRQEERRAATRCRLTERTVLEELDGDGKSKGKIIREFLVTQGQGEPSRELKSERFEGEPSSMFKQRPKQEKPHPGPFNPSERPHYRYELLAAKDPGAAIVRFTPLKPHERRMRGTAIVELPSGTLKEVSLEPTKYPFYLDALRVKVLLGETACGHQPVRFQVYGRGGILFVKARFRSDTSLEEHSLVGE